MNICHIIGYPGLAGSEKYSLYLAEEAKKGGHKVSFVLGEEGPLAGVLKEKEIPYKIIPMKSSFSPILVFRSALALRRFFKKEAIEIAHTGQLREQSLAIWAKIFGAKIKVVRTYHRLTQFNFLTGILTSFYNHLTDQFIAVSEQMKSEMEKRGLKNIEVIYNGVPKIKVKGHGKALGFLGRMAKEKGILEFIRENKEILKNTKLIIAGDGPEFKKIKELIENEKLSVKLLGEVRELSDFFSQISIQILPSAGESTVPLSILEGISAGIPAVIFEIESIKNKLGQNSGIVFVSKGNYREMGQQAAKVLEDNEKLTEMQNQSTKIYEKEFTIEKMWQKTESLYKELLS